MISSSTIWLAVGLAWVGVQFNGWGMDWVWICFAITAAPAALLTSWIVRTRMDDYEHGRRELPDVNGDATAMPAH